MHTIEELTQENVKAFTKGKSIAPLENGTTASKAYAIGEQFIRNGVLYKAKTAIASGATLTLNTNYELADKVATQIASLKETLTNQINYNDTKNLNNPAQYRNGTNGGITWTVNDDGTVTANGTMTSTSSQCPLGYYVFVAPFTAQVVLTGGVGYGYHIYPWDATTNTRPWTDSTKTKRQNQNSTSYTNEIPFYMEEGHAYNMRLRIQGTTGDIVSNEVFKPMLRLATDPDNTYEPYTKTNQQLTKETTGLIDNVNQNGAKNLLPISLDDIKAHATSGTWSGNAYTLKGVTFTVNDDGSVLVNGTATDVIAFRLNEIYDIPAGNYILSDGISNNSNNLNITTYKNDTWIAATNTGDNAPFAVDADGDIRQVIYVASGTTVNNVKFYPMLRLASDPDDTYVPYAMTNRQLTDISEYKAGDSITYPTSSLFHGFISNDRKTIYFTIPTSRKITARSATFAQSGGYNIRGVQGSMADGTGAYTIVSSFNKIYDNNIELTISRSDGDVFSNSVAATPVSVAMGGTLTFK